MSEPKHLEVRRGMSRPNGQEHIVRATFARPREVVNGDRISGADGNEMRVLEEALDLIERFLRQPRFKGGESRSGDSREA